MSEININGKKWTELVFEGKNKSYGAYQLRRESGRTTLKAFFFGILFIGSVCGGALMMSSFGDSAVMAPVPAGPELDPAEKVVVVDLAEKPAAPKKEVPSAPAEPLPENSSGDIVVTTMDNEPDATPSPNTNTPENTGPAGTPDGTESPTTGNATSGIASSAPSGPHRTGALDVQPKFPGGIDKFYTYVGNNFKKPHLDDERKMTVLVSFVIELDGSISDIRVLQNPGEGLDKEAIRVLKALKTKWEPGKINGKPVRTLYKLPITVVSE